MLVTIYLKIPFFKKENGYILYLSTAALFLAFVKTLPYHFQVPADLILLYSITQTMDSGFVDGSCWLRI